MSCCQACCDCDCCIGEIKETYPNLNEDTQILPPTSRSKFATNLIREIPERVDNKNNYLMSFGDITYEPILDLEELTKIKGVQLEVKKISFGDFHSLMLIQYPDGNGENSVLYGYGSNFNGELGIDYSLKNKKSNFYRSWTKVDVQNTIKKEKDKAFIFWGSLEYVINDVFVGDKFSIMTIRYTDGTIGLYRFELRKEMKFAVMEKELVSQKNIENQEQSEVEQIDKSRVSTIIRENFDGSENGGIKQVAVFNDRILILTENNSLYIKGTMYDMGNAVKYTLYKKFKVNILSLNIGINNCLLLGENNVIYAMGHNDYCEFGESNEKIKEIYSNKSKNLITSNNNNDGQNEINTNSNNNMVDEEKNSIDYFENNTFAKKGIKIKKMCTGARHSLILLENGQVYCFGDNSDGQCCGLEKIVSESSLVEFDDEKEGIIDIQAGFNHSIAKGKKGKIYVWGDSAWGKLGFKETRTDQYEPVEVSDLKIRNVIRLFAGPKQSAFFISGGITF